jgi:NUMOD3 motif
MAERIFYVYQYVDETGQPYYIGKGSGRRIHRPHTKTQLPPVDRRIIIQDNLTNEEAKLLEGQLISKYKRKIDGGILDNIKINQWACAVGWKHSEETKEKISKGNKGKKRTPEQLKNYKGTVTPEHKEKVRLANLGRPTDPERNAKISATLKAYFANKKAATIMEQTNG